MTIVPTGTPAWERTAGAESYGGNINKRNHLSIGSIDPETDLSAEEFSRIAADLAAVSRTAPFAVLSITTNDSSPAPPTVNSILQMTATNAVGYEGGSPPSGLPLLSRVGDGRFTVTWASSYLDDYGIEGALNVRCALGATNFSSAGEVSVEILSETSIDVRVFDYAGSAKPDAKITVEVW